MSARPALRFAEQRQRLLLRQLAETGQIEAARVAIDLGVSNESVRKDLALLEARGLLRRVHGGAVPVPDLVAEPDLGQRTAFSVEKKAIARAALAHIPASGSVLLDAGTTTAALAALLPTGRALAVWTNSLPVATVLADRGSVTVHILGGTIRRPTLAGVGPATLAALAAINVDVAFLGTNGISARRGMTTPDEHEAAVKNQMTRAARRRIVLADHSKFGRESLFRHAEPADVDLLITDRGATPDDLAGLARSGIAWEIAEGRP